MYLVVSLALPLVTDELSSSGDSKADDDPDKKSPKDKDSKDRERDREEGLFALLNLCNQSINHKILTFPFL